MRGWLLGLLVMLSLAPVAAGATGDAVNYLIGPGDVLKIAVYDHPDLAGTVRVNNDGSILLPLVGAVDVSGLTVADAAARISRALAEGYVVNPQVSLFVEEFRSRKAVIMGQVKNPGLYELRGPTTILELISKAGGLGEEAGETVSIKRKAVATGGDGQVVTINLRDLVERGDPAADVPVHDGDSVFVMAAGTLYVTGQVKRPNAYRIERETVLIKAITMAGGFTDLAAKGRIRVIRKIDGTERALQNVSLYERVLPDDVIVVPESFF